MLVIQVPEDWKRIETSVGIRGDSRELVLSWTVRCYLDRRGKMVSKPVASKNTLQPASAAITSCDCWAISMAAAEELLDAVE